MMGGAQYQVLLDRREITRRSFQCRSSAQDVVGLGQPDGITGLHFKALGRLRHALGTWRQIGSERSPLVGFLAEKAPPPWRGVPRRCQRLILRAVQAASPGGPTTCRWVDQKTRWESRSGWIQIGSRRGDDVAQGSSAIAPLAGRLIMCIDHGRCAGGDQQVSIATGRSYIRTHVTGFASGRR